MNIYRIVSYLEEKGLTVVPNGNKLVVTAKGNHLDKIEVTLSWTEINPFGDYEAPYCEYTATYMRYICGNETKIKQIEKGIQENPNTHFKICTISMYSSNSYKITLLNDLFVIDNRKPEEWCYSILNDVIKRVDESSLIWNK